MGFNNNKGSVVVFVSNRGLCDWEEVVAGHIRRAGDYFLRGR